MKAIEFLKQHRVYEDETIYNSVGEIVGTISQLMEEYATLCQPPISGSLLLTKVPKDFCQCQNPLVHDVKCPCGNDL